MFSLMTFLSNNGKLGSLGVYNSLRGKYGGGNDNSYSGGGTQEIKLSLYFPYSILICKASSCRHESHNINIAISVVKCFIFII